MRWVGLVVHMGEGRDIYRVLMGKPEGKRPFGRPRQRKEDIKMDIKEVGWEGMDCIDLVQDRDMCWALVNAVMNLQVPQNWGNFLTS
jgi:hypothetical protein